jgi:hypothetical protein
MFMHSLMKFALLLESKKMQERIFCELTSRITVFTMQRSFGKLKFAHIVEKFTLISDTRIFIKLLQVPSTYPNLQQ